MTEQTLIERLRLYSQGGGPKDSAQIMANVPLSDLNEAIAALSPVLPDEVQHALEWLSEYRGDDAQECRNLIERLARDNAVIDQHRRWLIDEELNYQQRIEELENKLSEGYPQPPKESSGSTKPNKGE